VFFLFGCSGGKNNKLLKNKYKKVGQKFGIYLEGIIEAETVQPVLS
jgi:hypothetical protein